MRRIEFHSPIRTSTRPNWRAVSAVLKSPRLSEGPVVEQFEQAFAAYLGRQHAVAVASGTLGLLLTLRAHGIGAGHDPQPRLIL